MNGGWSLFSQLPEKNEVVDRRLAALEAVLRLPAEAAVLPKRPLFEAALVVRHFAILLYTYLR